MLGCVEDNVIVRRVVDDLNGVVFGFRICLIHLVFQVLVRYKDIYDKNLHTVIDQDTLD